MRHAECYIKGYPRPQFVRKEWLSLDGEWKFAFGEEVSDAEALNGSLPRKITVPFSYETKLSGIGDTSRHDTVWYAREIEKKEGKRNILNIDGADYLCRVYIGGREVGEHEGAYARFSLDITDFLKTGKNILVIRCDDDNSPCRIRGKQRWAAESHGCSYVQTTGIWKSVWLEYADAVRLSYLRITPCMSDGTAEFVTSVTQPGDDVTVEIQIRHEGVTIYEGEWRAAERENRLKIGIFSEKILNQADGWLIEWPQIYDLRFVVRKDGKVSDEVGSYFGLSDFSAKRGRLIQHKSPIYLRMVLDQGYWPESGLTPPSEEAIEKDIRLTLDMGFNAVRKHQKIEDERYLYYADIMGLGIWCEMPSFFLFTEEAAEKFAIQWKEIIEQNYNHPSVLAWVCFNESWGVSNLSENVRMQNFVAAMYRLTKFYDPMRPVIGNDGWGHTETDILTLHHYQQDAEKLLSMYETEEKILEGDTHIGIPLPMADGWEYKGQPMMMSEFGGTAFAADKGKGWGYGSAVKDAEDYLKRFKSLVQAVKKMPLCGYCYTQLTDVQQEMNGLLREDRTPKADISEIRKINLI